MRALQTKRKEPSSSARCSPLPCSAPQMLCEVGAAMGPLSQKSFEDKSSGAISTGIRKHYLRVKSRAAWQSSGEGHKEAFAQPFGGEGVCSLVRLPSASQVGSQLHRMPPSAPTQLCSRGIAPLLRLGAGSPPHRLPQERAGSEESSEHQAPWPLTTPELTG